MMGRVVKAGLLAVGLLVAGLPLSSGGGEASAQVVFRHPLDDRPLDVELPEGEAATEAVRRFHETGENLYVGDPEAVAEGKRLYQRFCQACHLPDAAGRIGPNLVDEAFKYPRNGTDVGYFETIHGGAAGAMQAFGNRLGQDEILAVIAYIHSLAE
ncbi:c-type cytochrome [Arenibaculum sp.]|jgi:cytochrome c-L|uniref:c-type cytochrome n=1 Tax=Arenibaculum sp. TaxID=2865862 RepID=UPI002E10C09C|nr:c-type cytochrome [Arenibaculum sp.]